MTALVRTFIVGAIVPLIIALLGVIAILGAILDVPDPVAVHWNLAGHVDGTGPVWVPLVMVGLIPIAFSAFALFVARPKAGAPVSANQRVLLAAAPFIATVLAVTLAGSVMLQRGLANAYDAPGIGPVLLAAFAGGIALAVGSWFLLPKGERPAESPVAQPTPLAPSQKAAWMQRVGPQRGTVVILAVTAALVAGGAVIMWLLAPLPLAIAFTAMMVLLSALAAGTLDWRVTVGADGLRVRSALGMPAYHVPLAQIASVSSIQVDPVRDFGGWGVRWGGHRRWGVVTRRGEAIEVRRVDGSAFVVTVPGAGEGAALLASLAGRG